MNTVLLIILGLLPSLIWLAFYLREDAKRPEPKRLILFTFVVGAASTFIALGFQLLYNRWSFLLGILPYSLISLFFLASIEEVTKFLAVYFAVSKRKEFDEPIDPMIYMIVAALGFAAAENIATVFQAANSLETASLRFVGATLLHSLSSGLVGYYWGRALLLKMRCGAFVALGLLLAAVLHALFNYLIITTGPIGFAIAFLVFIAFFVLGDFEKLKR